MVTVERTQTEEREIRACPASAAAPSLTGLPVSAVRPGSSVSAGWRTRVRRGAWRTVVHLFLCAYAAVRRLATVLGPRPRRPDGPMIVLLTGTFHAEAWALAHLRPLAWSRECAELIVVSTLPLGDIRKVRVVLPPEWLTRIVGRVPARLLTFIAEAARRRPHVVGGFHLLLNGLIAQVVARCVGARAWYYCVGGPAEVLDGGLSSENRLFTRMEMPDPLVEEQLLEAVRRFDAIVTMGTRAAAFFREQGAAMPIHVMPGGMDAERFAPAATAEFDVIFVGRLAPIKRVDLLLRSLARVKEAYPGVRAVIVGDGPLLPMLQALASELGLRESVQFVGRQSDVAAWLRRARVFVLTSESEGLSLSLMEAALCGLPAVVPAVGDLGDLVEQGVNGFLVHEHTPECFAAHLVELLADKSRYAAMSDAARRGGLRYELSASVARWDDALCESREAAAERGDAARIVAR